MSDFLYLEPYSFIFKNEEEIVIFNSLNGRYDKFPNPSDIVMTVIESLEIPENGYNIEIPVEASKDIDFLNFVSQIERSHSGGIYTMSVKPFIIPPVCKINDSLERMKKWDGDYNGRKVLKNLYEVELYLSPFAIDEGESTRYKQFLSNHLFNSVVSIGKEQYLALLMQLSVARIPKVNFLNSSLCPFLNDILDNSSNYSFKQCFYLSDLKELSKFRERDLRNVDFVIDLTDKHSLLEYAHAIENMNGLNIKLRKVVSSADDLKSLDEIDESLANCLEIIPFYTGSNIDFFRKYIFNSLDDIIGQPISKKDIHRRQTLNEHFFGKLYILANGDIYPNLNYCAVGNVTTHNLAEIVYNEMKESSCWFLTRSAAEPCKDCVNKSLCPSLSNFELASGIPNMCFKYRDEKSQ